MRRITTKLNALRVGGKECDKQPGFVIWRPFSLPGKQLGAYITTVLTTENGCLSLPVKIMKL
jgi:hypothetical protein